MMNYEQFRTTWHEALTKVGMAPFLAPPTETLDLGHMNRTYQIYVRFASSRDIEPFSITAKLSWTWDALQSARTATVEEDVLMELLGMEQRYMDTEQPWLRVDVTLSASLPLDSPLPLPEAAIWRQWVVDVTARLAPLLPSEAGDEEQDRLVLSWRGKPESRVRYTPDGELCLAGVRLSAWHGINLPRQWYDPEREWEERPDDQVVDFAHRVWEALEEWKRSLRLLQPTATSRDRA
jgi:hypothetical protein